MGWIVAILIVALLGNLYLFSGYDVDGDIAEFMVGIAVLVDLVIIGYLIYLIVDKAKSKVKDVNNINLSDKKQCVINELKKQLLHKQDILSRFETYFSEKKYMFTFVSLISKCNTNDPITLVEAFNKKESCAFEELKTKIIPILTKDEKKDFPKTINDFVKYKKHIDNEISSLKEQLTAVASATKSDLTETIDNYCPILSKEIKKRKTKIIVSCVICIVTVVTIIVTSNYVNNAPYRELRTKIDNQTLTTEMIDWKNKGSEKSYYEYIHTDKGYKFLANVLSELHKNNDIKKAMWLLCVQPDCINGIDLCASDSFIDWVVDYAEENGTKMEDSDGDITYTVNGYKISISSIFDYSIGHSFQITNGKEITHIYNKNKYHDGTVPTIK